MSPSEAMPITTVTKMTGAVTVLMSCRNASASHLASVAGPGATRPNTMPAAIATSTQNHSCRFMGRALLSSLSCPRPSAANRRRSYERRSALSRLWSYWSKTSFWSRENMPPMRVNSLAGRLLILQLAVVAVTVAAGAVITVQVARERTETAARDRSLTVARTVAALPDLPDALGTSRPSSTLQPLTERVRRVADVDFITIMRPDGTRYTHPNPRLIGQHFVGTYAPAAHGRTITETTNGTLGKSVRAVVPVTEDGKVVALVAVGVLTDAIGEEVAALLPGLLGLAAVILVIGSVFSLLLARRVKRQTLGLEPQEITTLYAHHDATLHALREGVVVFDEEDRPALVNDHAQRLLGPDLATLAPGELKDDAPLIAGDRVLLASSRAVERDGRRVAPVVPPRARTGVETLARERGAVPALADALRAQTHEAPNRLHVIAGLIELGRTEEAIELA